MKTITNSRINHCLSLIDKERETLWKWFSCQHKYTANCVGPSMLSMLNRTAELGVPYEVGCMVDERLNELDELAETLENMKL